MPPLSVYVAPYTTAAQITATLPKAASKAMAQRRILRLTPWRAPRVKSVVSTECMTASLLDTTVCGASYRELRNLDANLYSRVTTMQ